MTQQPVYDVDQGRACKGGLSEPRGARCLRLSAVALLSHINVWNGRGKRARPACSPPRVELGLPCGMAEWPPGQARQPAGSRRCQAAEACVWRSTQAFPSFLFFGQISHVRDPDPLGEDVDPSSSWKAMKNLQACLATNSVSMSTELSRETGEAGRMLSIH